MTIAIMQPYFLPYIGYFTLIKQSEQFILFDTPQYIRHGWIDRNKILKPNGEFLYVKVPLKKHQQKSTINEVIIDNKQNWKERILAQLVPYKKKAPFYWQVLKLLKEIFEFETESIVKLNQFSLSKICEYLEIDTPIQVWSEMNIEIEEVNAPDEWALNICRVLNADTYYNPTGGMSFFDRSKYEKEGVELKFMQIEPISYTQFTNEFVPFLSIIDVMMFNSLEEIQKMLDNYTLI